MVRLIEHGGREFELVDRGPLSGKPVLLYDAFNARRFLLSLCDDYHNRLAMRSV